MRKQNVLQNTQKYGNIPTPKLSLKNSDARIEKRPLLHPPVPSPYAGANQPKIIYIATKTPFISAVKRVRALLKQVEQRATPHIDLVNGKGNNKQKLNALAESSRVAQEKEPEAVILKGTNKAIEKVASLALYLRDECGYKVGLKTGSIATVDDIVRPDDVVVKQEGEDDEGEQDDEELPESQVRWLSVLEAHITMK